MGICQMYVSIWHIAFLYVTYVYLQAFLHVGCIPDSPVMCIRIGSLSTLFVFTPCPVKLDYIDNNRVIAYSIYPYVTCTYAYVNHVYMFIYHISMCIYVPYVLHIHMYHYMHMQAQKPSFIPRPLVKDDGGLGMKLGF